MSRSSNDHIKGRHIFEGFDYRLQVWVSAGVVNRCPHVEQQPGCNACRLGGKPVAECAGAETFPEDQSVRVFLLGPEEDRPDVCWYFPQCPTCLGFTTFILRVADLNELLAAGERRELTAALVDRLFPYLTEDERRTLELGDCAKCRRRLQIESLQDARRGEGTTRPASLELARLLLTSTGLFQLWLELADDERKFGYEPDDNPLAVYLRTYGLDEALVSLRPPSARLRGRKLRPEGWALDYINALVAAEPSTLRTYETESARMRLQEVLQRAVYALPFEPPPAHLLG